MQVGSGSSVILPTLSTVDNTAALARLAAMSKNANARVFALELAVATGQSKGSDSPSPQIITTANGSRAAVFSPGAMAHAGTTSASSSSKNGKQPKRNERTKGPSSKR